MVGWCGCGWVVWVWLSLVDVVGCGVVLGGVAAV